MLKGSSETMVGVIFSPNNQDEVQQAMRRGSIRRHQLRAHSTCRRVAGIMLRLIMFRIPCEGTYPLTFTMTSTHN